MARPEAKIDLGELEKLCGMQCTDRGDRRLLRHQYAHYRTPTQSGSSSAEIMDNAQSQRPGLSSPQPVQAGWPAAMSPPPFSFPRTCSATATS